MKVRRWLIGLGATALIGATTACTPQQIAAWVAWNEQDPVAAQEFARRPEVQQDLRESQSRPSGGGGGGSGGNGVWDRLAQCESGGNWGINTGNGYYGGLQFLASTWRAYGGSGMPHHASREEQIRIAERVRADVGWGAWPACTRKLGLR
jgi:resuscitation-promoting factor RpfB